MYSCTVTLSVALYGGQWPKPHPGCFASGKETQYPLYRRLGGLLGWSGRLQKILRHSPRGFLSLDHPAGIELLHMPHGSKLNLSIMDE